jgi:hypothetical protein
MASDNDRPPSSEEMVLRAREAQRSESTSPMMMCGRLAMPVGLGP